MGEASIVGDLLHIPQRLFRTSSVALEAIAISKYALDTLLRCPGFDLILRLIAILRDCVFVYMVEDEP
jgi:hypothetical protein